MTRFRFVAPLIASTVLLGMAGSAFAQAKFEIVTGKPFDSALPKDFYLEGNAIPTEKLNSVLVHLPGGQRALFGLIDTTGYSSNIQAKYVGMIITEADVSVCGQKLGTGSYGFGWTQPANGVDQPGKILVYNQAGDKITECDTPRDANLKQPKPLQVVPTGAGVARLYHGRHYVELR